MKARGKDGMSDAAVADFVSRYMPAYDAFLPDLYRAARGSGVKGRCPLPGGKRFCIKPLIYFSLYIYISKFRELALP